MRLARLLFFFALFAPALAFAQVDERHLDEHGQIRKDSLWIEMITGDSLWVDSAHVDSLLQLDTLRTEEAKQQIRLSDVPRGFHPSYRLQFNELQTTRDINNQFRIAYPIGNNVVVSDTSSFDLRSSTSANRETRIRSDKVALDYLVTKTFKFNVRALQDVNTNITNDVDITKITDRKLSLGAIWRNTVPFGFRLNLTMRGTMTARDRENEDERGSGDDLRLVTTLDDRNGTLGRMGFNFRSPNGFPVELVLTGGATRGRTRIETSGNESETVVNDDNRDANDNLDLTVNYERFEWLKANVSASADRSTKNFARIQDNAIEEQKDNNLSLSMRTRGRINERLDYQSTIRISASERRNRLEVDQSQDRDDLLFDLTTNYKLPGRVQSKFTMKRQFTKDVDFDATAENPDSLFESGQTVDTHRGEVSLNLTRKTWKYTTLRAASTLGLTSRFFVDDTQDKDDVSRRAQFGLDYKKPEGKLDGTATFSIDENESVNIDRSRSGGNQTRQTIKVTPTISYKLFPSFVIRSSYNLRLVYNFKSNQNSQNTMSRIGELRSNMRWSLAPKTKLRLEYQFKRDESGRFEEDGRRRIFFRDAETSTQKMQLDVDYRTFFDIKIGATQFFEVLKRYNIRQEKQLDNSDHRARISFNVDWQQNLPKNARVSLRSELSRNSSIPIFRRTSSLPEKTDRTVFEVRSTFSVQF
ncbi:MAG: hypothetical protein HKN20_11875 [Gemmatimonadetes bacterium]|nr:hypothetical protein [Gemmatimonadota bacterium]